MQHPAHNRRLPLHRAALVASVTCTGLLAISGLLTLSLFLVETYVGALALVFLALLGGGFLLPLGGLLFGALAALVAQDRSGRRTAAYAVVACALIAGALFVLAAYYPPYRE